MRDPILRLAPVMTVREIVHLENLLLQEAAHASGRLDVFEWGAGGSTHYFPSFLRSRGVPFSWVTAEHDPGWAARVASLLEEDGLAGVRVKLLDPTEDNPKEEEHRSFPMDDYVSYPSKLRRNFDVMIVDGRRRRRCLLEAARRVVPGGLVVLHDAHRPYYACAFSAYDEHRFTPNTTFWEGRVRG